MAAPEFRGARNSLTRASCQQFCADMARMISEFPSVAVWSRPLAHVDVVPRPCGRWYRFWHSRHCSPSAPSGSNTFSLPHPQVRSRVSRAQLCPRLPVGVGYAAFGDPPPCHIANLTPAVAFLRLRTPARPALTTHRDAVSWFSLTLNRSPRRQISRNEVMLYSIIRRNFAVSSWIIRDANPLAIPFSTTSLTVSTDPGSCTTGRCARAAFGLTDGWVRRGNFPAKCGSGSSIGSNPTRAHSFED